MHETLSKDGNSAIFLMGLYNEEEYRWKKVEYVSRYDNIYINCACAKFEMVGLLCRHALSYCGRRKSVYSPAIIFWIDGHLRLDFESSIWVLECHPQILESRHTAGSSRANKTKHKEAKVEVKDLNILDGFRDNFLHHLSLKRNNDNNRSIVDSDNENLTLIDLMPQFCVRDPARPVRTKGRSKIATRINSGFKLAKQNREKIN